MPFFFGRKQTDISPLKADLHSHLLPGIDDGAKDMNTSLELLQKFEKAGFRKLVTTPHIMWDYYKNTPEIISSKLSELQKSVQKAGIDLQLEAAAEYYLDEHFMSLLEREETLLCFGKEKYVLFETSYINPSPYFQTAFFQMKSQGYTPVLAHPERYSYLFDNIELLEEWHSSGVLFQLNLNSVVGYYSKAVKKLAEELIEQTWVDFIATDCHGHRHFSYHKKAWASKLFKKAMDTCPLLNETLLEEA